MADITAITARIGGGKTLWSVIQIIKSLEKTDRLIVTDIPLVMSNASGRLWTIAEYCHMFIKRPIDVSKRIVYLDFEQAREFWRYVPADGYDEAYVSEQLQSGKVAYVESEWKYGRSRLLCLPNKKNDVFKVVPDFAFRCGDVRGNRGIDYFIDEAHKKFPPLYYQTVGAACDWYVSELRRLDDNLFWITQHPEKVDKNFRRLTTEWFQVQNMSKSPLTFGMTIKDRFRWHWYSQSDMPSRLEKPTMSGWYSLDKKRRYHDLYDTMMTSSMSGNALLHGEKYHGRSPFVVIPIVIMVILVGAWTVPHVLTFGFTFVTRHVVGAAFTGVKRGATSAMAVKPIHTRVSAGAGSGPTVMAPVHIPIPVMQFPQVPVGTVTVTQPTANTGSTSQDWVGVNVTGVASSPDGVEVFLSNGMILDTNDVAAIGKRWVKLRDGTKLPVMGQTPESSLEKPEWARAITPHF